VYPMKGSWQISVFYLTFFSFLLGGGVDVGFWESSWERSGEREGERTMHI